MRKFINLECVDTFTKGVFFFRGNTHSRKKTDRERKSTKLRRVLVYTRKTFRPIDRLRLCRK